MSQPGDLGPGWVPDSTPYYAILRMSGGRRFVLLGGLLISTLLLPVSGDAGASAWVWHLWSGVGWWERAGLLAPSLLGAALLALGLASGLSRFWTGLGGIVALFGFGALFAGSDLQAFQAFDGFTGFVGRNPLLVLVGLSLVAAGAELTVREEARLVGRTLLAAGGVLLVLFSLLPWSGTPLVAQLAGHGWALAQLGRWRLFAGNVVFWGLALVPLFVGVLGLYSAFRKGRSPWSLAHVSRFLLPGLVLMMTYPALMVGLGPEAALLQIRAALLILAVVNVAARSIEMLGADLLEYCVPPGAPFSDWLRDAIVREILGWCADPLNNGRDGVAQCELAPAWAKYPRPMVWLAKRRLAELKSELGLPVAGTWDAESLARATEFLGPAPKSLSGQSRLTAWLWARRPRVPVAASALVLGLGLLTWAPWGDVSGTLDWDLGPRSKAGDQLFEEALPTYVAALAARDRALVDKVGAAEAAVEIRQAAIEAQALARQIDPELGERVARVLRMSEKPSGSAVGWIRSLDRLNHRIRELGLPYHVYANAIEYQSEGKKYRFLYVNTYLVEELRWFESEGKTLASMLARRLDRLRFEGDGLGRVVRHDPFANLLLDTVERTSGDLVDALYTALCEPVGYSSTATPFDEILWKGVGEQCGSLLAQTVGDVVYEEGITEMAHEAILNVTQRHELQHQADPPNLAIPVAVLVAHPSRSDAFLRLVSRELSAYVCELNSLLPLEQAFALLGMMQTIMTEPFAGTPEYIVGALVLGKMAGIEVLDERGVASAAAVARVSSALAGLGAQQLPATLAQRAQSAHEEWFGEPCAAPVLARTATASTR